jgi:hypothetical protein
VALYKKLLAFGGVGVVDCPEAKQTRPKSSVALIPLIAASLILVKKKYLEMSSFVFNSPCSWIT